MYYDTKESDEGDAVVARCEQFIDVFAPMIPCAHCDYHFNEFLYGTKNPNIDTVTVTAAASMDHLWDWENDGSPCKDADNLKHSFAKAHNNVGQNVDENKVTEKTRPTFIVEDLDGLYK